MRRRVLFASFLLVSGCSSGGSGASPSGQPVDAAAPPSASVPAPASVLPSLPGRPAATVATSARPRVSAAASAPRRPARASAPAATTRAAQPAVGPATPAASSTPTPTRAPRPTASPTASSTASPTGTPTATTAPATTASLAIIDYAFDPRSLVVTVGTTVRATNRGQVTHTWTSTTGLWDSGNLSAGQSFSYRFSTAGVFAFVCTIHPNMTGSVTVH